MLRCKTDSVKLFVPGGPVPRIGLSFCARRPSNGPTRAAKFSGAASKQIGFVNAVAFVGMEANRFLQHGRSPQPFFFCGCGARLAAACIGHSSEAVATVDGDESESIAAANEQWLVATSHEAKASAVRGARQNKAGPVIDCDDNRLRLGNLVAKASPARTLRRFGATANAKRRVVKSQHIVTATD